MYRLHILNSGADPSWLIGREAGYIVDKPAVHHRAHRDKRLFTPTGNLPFLSVWRKSLDCVSWTNLTLHANRCTTVPSPVKNTIILIFCLYATANECCLDYDFYQYNAKVLSINAFAKLQNTECECKMTRQCQFPLSPVSGFLIFSLLRMNS